MLSMCFRVCFFRHICLVFNIYSNYSYLLLLRTSYSMCMCSMSCVLVLLLALAHIHTFVYSDEWPPQHYCTDISFRSERECILLPTLLACRVVVPNTLSFIPHPHRVCVCVLHPHSLLPHCLFLCISLSQWSISYHWFRWSYLIAVFCASMSFLTSPFNSLSFVLCPTLPSSFQFPERLSQTVLRIGPLPMATHSL